MTELISTVAEARANFSKIATAVNHTKKPVTVLKNSKPWVRIVPVDNSMEAPIPNIDWSRVDIADIDTVYGHTILPAKLDDDEDFYNDFV